MKFTTGAAVAKTSPALGFGLVDREEVWLVDTGILDEYSGADCELFARGVGHCGYQIEMK